ncbi:hypothetical protein E2320_001342 [Naja naja]|nr:hypothetical protein E2320_001342 [Naja naja]
MKSSDSVGNIVGSSSHSPLPDAPQAWTMCLFSPYRLKETLSPYWKAALLSRQGMLSGPREAMGDQPN